MKNKIVLIDGFKEKIRSFFSSLHKKVLMKPDEEISKGRSVRVEGKLFTDVKLTSFKTHSVGFSKNYIIKIEHERNKDKLRSLSEEVKIIKFLNSANCKSCPLLISSGKLKNGKLYFIQERIKGVGVPSYADMFFSLIEQKNLGVYQGDFKKENMIFDGDVCYLIDYDQAYFDKNFIEMSNIKFLDWIANDCKKRWNFDFYNNPTRKFNKKKIFKLFKDGSFNIGETSVVKNQITTNTKSGIYHSLNNKKIYVEGARSLKDRVKVLDKIKFNRKERILDVGCNLGLLGHYLYDRGCTVTGIDMDKNIIKAAEMVVNILGKKILFESVDIDKNSGIFKRGFDTVCFFSVFHHLKDGEIIARSLHKYFKRIIIECNLNEGGSKPVNGSWVTTNGWNFENIDGLIKLLEKFFVHFKFIKNYGQVDRDRYILEFKVKNKT